MRPGPAGHSGNKTGESRIRRLHQEVKRFYELHRGRGGDKEAPTSNPWCSKKRRQNTLKRENAIFCWTDDAKNSRKSEKKNSRRQQIPK